jgi:hypothetical protein
VPALSTHEPRESQLVAADRQVRSAGDGLHDQTALATECRAAI